jgi:hypothetical protein
MDATKATEIATLNDKFRRGGDGVVITRGVMGLDDLAGLLREVKGYEAFTADNDPHGEHDFGVIAWGSKKVFWKIDYYDQAAERWHDPLSPLCKRVLTVMLASEY